MLPATGSTTDAGNATPTHTSPPRTPLHRLSLSTEHRCRRADGVRQRDPGRCFDHYGLRWSATSHTPSLCLSVNLEHVFLFYIPALVNLTKRNPNNGTRARFREETGSGKKIESLTLRPNPNSPNQIREGKRGGSESKNPRPKSERGKKGKKKERRVETLTLTPVFHSDERKERNRKQRKPNRQEQTLTLTLVSHSDKPEKNNSNQKGESGVRVRVRRMNLRRRGRRSRAGGAGSPGSAKEVPRPGRSTAACSPVGEHARRRGGQRRRQSPLRFFLARGCSAVTVSAAAEKRQAARRERGEEPNA